MHKTTIYLPEDLKAALEQISADTGRSETDLIREGIRLALAQQAPPVPRAGIFASGDPGLSARVDDMLHGFGTP